MRSDLYINIIDYIRYKFIYATKETRRNKEWVEAKFIPRPLGRAIIAKLGGCLSNPRPHQLLNPFLHRRQRHRDLYIIQNPLLQRRLQITVDGI